MLEGIGKVSDQRPQIRGALIRNKLAGGAWCCGRPNCWIQGPHKNEIAVGLQKILTNVIAGPWSWFFVLYKCHSPHPPM